MATSARTRRRLTKPKKEANENKLKALDMRLTGASYREIGRTLRVSHVQAWHYVQDMLQDYAQEPTQAVRLAEVARLDRLMLAHWAKAIKGDTKATQMVLGIMDRRARLLGLDSPQKVDISGFIRTMALKEGLDPEQAVRDAEAIVAAQGR